MKAARSPLWELGGSDLEFGLLYALLQAAFRKTGNAEAREVLSDTSRRIAAMGTAGLLLCPQFN
jgi:hypothetical protein